MAAMLETLSATLNQCNVLLSVAVGTLCLLMLYKATRPKHRLPPGPWCLPIVGYMPFLGNEPHRTLDNLTKKYGKVFRLYFGRTPVIVVSDFASVKEALGSGATTDRPPGFFDLVPDGLGFSGTNGQEWVDQRRFSVKTMRDLGIGRSEWVRLIEDEVSDFIQEVQIHGGQPMDISTSLTSSVSNNISSMVFGKRLPVGDPNRELLDRTLDIVPRILNPSGFSSNFRWLVRLMDRFNIGTYGKHLALIRDFNNYIRKEVDLHRSAAVPVANNFIDDYLQEMEVQKKENENTTFHDNNLIGNTQALFTGGSETTRSSISWLILAMAEYPNIQKNVHAEIDSVLKAGQTASWEDRANLPYTYAAIMEGQRWKTIVPLNPGRQVSENMKVSGFDIPKDWIIISNIWAVNNDTRYWEDPEKFIPERFLEDGGKVVNLRPESYLPFSYGRRNCPGETIAMMEIFLYFSTLMQLFEVRTPDGGKPCLDAVLALTYQPTSQLLCFVPRSPKSKSG